MLALTIPERETIIRALDDAPPGLEGAPRRPAARARRPGAGRARLAERAARDATLVCVIANFGCSLNV